MGSKSVATQILEAINDENLSQYATDSDLNTHANNTTHITPEEREAWNEKASSAYVNEELDKLNDLIGTDSVATQISEAINKENLSQYATDSDLIAHANDATHITPEERENWNFMC